MCHSLIKKKELTTLQMLKQSVGYCQMITSGCAHLCCTLCHCFNKPFFLQKLLLDFLILRSWKMLFNNKYKTYIKLYIFQFIVIKFLQDDSGDVIYEAGLTKWLISLDENMIGNIHWPPTHLLVTKCVQKEVEADLLWPQFKIEVKRYYG